jgi:hypothetical protein
MGVTVLNTSVIHVNLLGGCTLLARIRRVDTDIIKVLIANNGVWLTTKEIGWIMGQLCGMSPNGKTICRRIMGFEYMPPEFLHGGRVDSLKLGKAESQRLKCKYKYRWIVNATEQDTAYG